MLAAAWYVGGFSPERGIFPAKLFRGDDFPSDVEYLLGDVNEKWHKRFHLSLPSSDLYISYSKGCINSSSTDIAVFKASN